MTTHLYETRKAFDKAASEYDVRDNANHILRWMRGVVHKIYTEHLKPESRILELNAGTGVDARYLASLGMSVFATDISEEMIKVLTANSADYIENGAICAEAKSFNEIGGIPQSDFDAVISNFGGLNCINDFNRLSRDIADKLKYDGLFIAVVMNKLCPWEILYYLLRFKPTEAARRFSRDGVFADLNGINVRTFYYTPYSFAEAFSEFFKIKKIYTLGLFTPPPYLSGIYKKFKPLVRFFMKTDELICKTFPFNLIGDHFILVMSRRNCA